MYIKWEIGKNMPIANPTHIFKYNDSVSVESNFSEWYMLNSDERVAWGDKPYSREEALEVFFNLFEKKVDNLVGDLYTK